MSDRDLHAFLPNTRNLEIVSFFSSCFKKTSKLNGEDECRFHKYLPAHLNECYEDIFAQLIATSSALIMSLLSMN